MNKLEEFVPFPDLNCLTIKTGNILSDRIVQYTGRPIKGEMVSGKCKIGIEIECEHILNFPTVTDEYGNRFWKSDKDDSLRNNGCEFISNGPIVSKFVPAALHEMEHYILAHNPKHEFSDRTSVHVHVDCRKSLIRDIFSNVVIFTCLEKVFFKLIEKRGMSRSNNIFCTPINDSGPMIGSNILLEWLKPEGEMFWDYLMSLKDMWNKYSSLNIWPLFDHHKGTIEYRMMHGTRDSEFLVDYINMLICMKLYATKKDPAEIFKTILDLNSTSYYEAFVKDIFGDVLFFKYFEPMDLKPLMEVAVEHLKNVYALSMEKDFSLMHMGERE